MERTTLLIERWMDDDLDAAGRAELEGILLESADARREFWERAAFHGQILQAAKVAFGTLPALDAPTRTVVVPSSALAQARRPLGWLRRGMAAGTAAILIGGCGIGSVVTSIAWSYSTTPARSGAAIRAHHESFETPPAPQPNYVPRQTDVWSGDETEVVTTERGVIPHSGTHMLRFVSSHPRDESYEGRASELWRVVDVERFRPADGGEVRMELSACFNAVATDADERLGCGLNVVATDAAPGSLGEQWLERFWSEHARPGTVAVSKAATALDDDPTTWQRLSVTVTVPSGARYIVLHCVADGMKNGAPAWLDAGQYIDDISLVATPVDPADGRVNSEGGR
jgi:hypothetical protein